MPPGIGGQPSEAPSNSGFALLVALALVVVHGEALQMIGRARPQRYASVRAVVAQDVVRHVHVRQLVHVAVVVADDALEGVHAGLFGRHAVAHVFDDRVSAADLDVLFAVAGGARRAYVLIAIAAGADDGRVARASGNLPRQTAGCGCARHLTLFIQR